jgi:glycosyltransferase involved in cell wall biosynthesis
VETVHPGTAAIANAVGNAGVEAPPELDAERFRKTYRVPGDYLLFGGRSTAGKGTEEMLAGIRALRRTHPQAQLVLTGEAGESLAAEPSVVPIGRLDERERWDAIAGASGVLVPSFHESLSLLALEAWAAGRPALLNGASPVLRAQAERSGGAFTYRGPSELAAAAGRLLDDPRLAARLGEAGRAYVRATYRWDDVLDGFEGLLATATERASARRRM